MSETIQTILVILGTIFDMFTTIMFYKTCIGNKNIRVNKIVFYTSFIFLFAVDLALSQFGLAGLFYTIKSFAIFLILTLLYNSKWIIRFFTALSYLVICMISELIKLWYHYFHYGKYI